MRSTPRPERRLALDRVSGTELTGGTEPLVGEAAPIRSDLLDQLSLAAHEMRAPLGVVAGYVSMLRSGDLGEVPPGWRAALDTVRAKVEEIGGIVEDLLTASRARAGQAASQPEPVDLREVVSDATASASLRARLIGASLGCAVPDAEVPAEVDRRQVQCVLDNLINNAFNYSESPPRVDVSLSVVEGKAEIRVTDHGIGIPRKMRRRIFERFRRGGPAAFHPGTGLGLAIARDMAEINGGRLLLDSSVVGEGSSCLLRLPVLGRSTSVELPASA